MKKLVILYILFVLITTPIALANSSIITENTFEDSLLNSPFLILGAIIIANIIAVIYRKVKR